MDAENPMLSIIVISYNTLEMTYECIKSIYDETKNLKFEIVMLDNASSDGTVDLISKSFPDVRVIASRENLGFARGNNEAIKYTRAPNLLLLNPDTVILNNAIERLFEFATEHPEYGIWGGKTLYADGSLNPTSCFAQMTMWSLFCRAFGLTATFPRSEFFNPEYYGDWNRDTPRNVDIVCGCFFLIRREAWNKLNGFNRMYFMYGEEVDLCLRAKQQGYRPAITPDATIIHHGGASQKIRQDKMVLLLSGKVQIILDHWRSLFRSSGVFLIKVWVINRIIAYWLYDRLQREEKTSEALAVWTGVWKQRIKWESGFNL